MRLLKYMKASFLIIVGLLFVGCGVVVGNNYLEQNAIASLDKDGSSEYKQYVESINKINEQWPVLETELKSKGLNTQDIELAKKDYHYFISSTILLRVQLESSLSDIEKKAVLQKLVEHGIKNKSILTRDTGCEYIEKKLPLQDFFVGATLKFKKLMVYIDWKGEQARYCSPSFAVAKYYSLESVDAWSHVIFDKKGRGVKEYQIDPSVTFTVMGRFQLLRQSFISNSKSDYYILKDSNGLVSVVPFSRIFDMDFQDEGVAALNQRTGSVLYKDEKLIGHVVSDSTSGGVWIKGTPVPQIVIDANTRKKPTSFPNTVTKKTEFLERVILAIDDGKIVNFTNKELVENDIGKDVYTNQNHELTNNFGGKISLKKNGDTVSVVFEKIPAGKDCYEFYYMNSPKIYGFEESFIDGVLERYDLNGSNVWNSASHESFKQKVCYSGKETVTIEFRGKLNKIKEQASFFKKLNTPRYTPTGYYTSKSK